MRKPRFFCVHIVQMVEKKNSTCFRNPAVYRSSWQVGKISISMGVFTKERHHITQIADTFWPSTSWKGKVAGRFCGGPSDAWRWWKLRGFYWKNKIKHLLVPNRYIWDHLIHFPNQPRFAGKFLRKHSIPWGLGNNVDFSQLLFQRGRLFYITFLAGKLGWPGCRFLKDLRKYRSLTGHQTTRRWPTVLPKIPQIHRKIPAFQTKLRLFAIDLLDF